MTSILAMATVAEGARSSKLGQIPVVCNTCGMKAQSRDAPDVVDAVLRASRVLVSVAVRSLEGVDGDVTLAQCRALVVLAARGPQRPTGLAEALGVHPSTVTRLCDRLVAKRLVHRRESPTNRREVNIALTPKGRVLVDAVTEKRRSEIAKIVSRVPSGERSTLVHALTALGTAAGEPADADWFWGHE